MKWTTIELFDDTWRAAAPGRLRRARRRARGLGRRRPASVCQRLLYHQYTVYYYMGTMTSDEEAPFPYKLTKPCQIVRVTQRRRSQLSLTSPSGVP